MLWYRLLDRLPGEAQMRNGSIASPSARSIVSSSVGVSTLGLPLKRDLPDLLLLGDDEDDDHAAVAVGSALASTLANFLRL